MLLGTAHAAVRRLRVPHRAASGLLTVVVGLAVGALVGLGAVTVDSAPRPVTRAVLGDARASLVRPDATPAPPSSEERLGPSPASVVGLSGSGRLARPAVTAGDIPPAAWDAYLRAAAVMARAAPRCELDWPVLAAIGLVESDHGRDLPASGAAAESQRAAPDTDAGRLDGDPHRDLPVGPMRLLPSTWQVIGVDGDGDGVRSPTDPDDAALAVGGARGAGDADLGTTAGLRRALLRFAPSRAYVDLVIGLARTYAETGLGPPASLDVTAVAHPVVDGTRTTRARRALAHRVTVAQAAAAGSVGVGTSKSAQLLAAALGGAGPEPTSAPATAAGSASSGAPAEQPSASGPAPAPSASAGPSPSESPSGGGAASPSPSDPAPTDPAPTDPAPSDPTPSDPTPSDPAPSDPAPSDPSPTDPAPSDPTPTDPAPTCPAPDPAATDPAASASPTQPGDPAGGSASPVDPTDPCGTTLSPSPSVEPSPAVP
ncbi:MAG: hypothetical protein ACTHKG_04245 [Nocardioides sp.]